MKPEIYIGYLMLVLFGIFILLKLAANFIDHMWYKKKDKPTKMNDFVCGRTGNPINSEEYFFGMCGSCHRINNAGGTKCNGMIKKEDHVKS